MNKLLPCPFCGEQPKVLKSTGEIMCGGQECFGPVTTAANINDSTVQWNKRSPAPEWQDISTAPTDGTVILICGVSLPGETFITDAKWVGSSWMVFRPDDNNYTARCNLISHWMPLPVPPMAVIADHRGTP